MALPVFKGPFTVDTYQRLGELGVLREDARVELIAGQVIEMTPIGDRHASCVRRLHDLLAHRALEGAIIDVQNPVVLGRRDAPQPDVAVLRRRADRYPHHPHARDILLVVEVADTSLSYDRDVKIPVYARSGVPEAWLVDLTTDAISVSRGPSPDGYGDIVTVTRGEVLRPLLLSGVTIAVDEILA
jgi:Uma2 family endonuclease